MNTYYMKQRDDYGRSTHQLIAAAPVYKCLGVIVKHPLRKIGEPDAYWYCRWDLPVDAPKEEKVVYFPNLRSAKAALESATEVA